MAKKELTFDRELSFGIEIEISDLSLTKNQLVEKFTEAGIESRVPTSYYSEHSNYDMWKIEYDGSLTGNNPMEIVSPVLKGIAGLEELQKVLMVLNENGADVNKDCGVHVHHWAGDLDFRAVKNVYKLYAKHEQAIDEIFPPSRYNGYYTKLINGTWQQWGKYFDAPVTVLEAVESMKDMHQFKLRIGAMRQVQNGRTYPKERYYKVNAVALVRQGTLEFRQHSGSTDYEKLMNWVIITHKIIEIADAKKTIRKKSESRIQRGIHGDAKRGKTPSTERNWDLYNELKLSGTSVSQFIGKRQQHFRKQGLGQRGTYQ